MGIRFLCHDCDRKLNVKDFLAGKRGICPHCGASVMIPMESQLPSSKKTKSGAIGSSSDGAAEANDSLGKSVVIATQGEHPGQEGVVQFPTADALAANPDAETADVESTRVDPIEEDPDAVWYVRPPSGGQFGPADGDVMRRWISEKRVSADGLVWREGWPEWKKGRDVFPQLSGRPTPPADRASSSSPPSIAAGPTNAATIGPTQETASLYSSRKKKKQGVGIAAIIVLGVLIAVLAVTLGVIVATKS